MREATRAAIVALDLTECPACGQTLNEHDPATASICGFADESALPHFVNWVRSTLHVEDNERLIARMIVMHAEDPEYYEANGWPALRDAAEASI